MTTSANKPFRDEYFFGIILIVLTVTPLLFSHLFMYGFHVPKYLFFQLTVFLLLTVTLFRKEFRIRLNLLDLVILLRPLYLMLLYLISSNYSSIFENIDILTYLTLFYLLISHYWGQDNSPGLNRHFRILVAGIVIVCIIESIYGLLQYFGIDPFHSGGYQSYESNAIGTFGSENALGGFLAAGVPLALYLFNIMIDKKIKGLLIPGIGLMLITLALTISRGAWIALILGLLFLGWPLIIQSGKRLFSNKYLKTIVIVLLIIISITLLLGIYQINAESSLGRLYIWRISLGMVKDYPVLGVGYGNYGYQYLNYQATFFSNPDHLIYRDKAVGLKEAHSEIIHVLAETGIIGFILFLSIFVLFYYYAHSVLKHRFPDKKSRFLMRCIIASVLVISIHSMVDNVLHVLPIALLLYFALAVISTETKKEISISNTPGTNVLTKPLVNWSFRGNLIFPVVGIMLLVLNGYFIVNKANGYTLWKKGQDSVHQGHWSEGIDYYQQALEYLPENGELQFHLGAAYSYTGESEKAINLLTQSLAKFNDKNIYLTLGHAYQISGEYHKAEENFRTVTRMYPQMLLPHLWLAELYYEMGERDQSIQELRLIINAKTKILSDDVISIKRDAGRFLRIILKAD